MKNSSKSKSAPKMQVKMMMKKKEMAKMKKMC